MLRTYLSLIIVFTVVSVHAQTFIPRVGASINYNTKAVTDTDSKVGIGFLAGFGYSLRMDDHLSFQPEVYYISKRYSYSTQTTQSTIKDGTTFITTAKYSDKYNLSYIEIPLLLKYKLLKDKMFVILGPSMSIGIGGKHSYQYETTYTNADPISSSGSENVVFGNTAAAVTNAGRIDRRFDFGMQPGVGYVLPHNIQLELRCNVGTISLFKTATSKNETFMLSVSMPVSFRGNEE